MFYANSCQEAERRVNKKIYKKNQVRVPSKY